MSWLKKEAADMPPFGGAPKPDAKKEPVTADSVKKNLTELIQKEKVGEKNVKSLEQALKSVEEFLKESKGEDKAPKEKSEEGDKEEKKEEPKEEKDAE